ncbi:MAG: phosphoribosylamine--glycine ligase [Spirochaetales bacterium]|nr:phosphoribosylamine--glycine ligase [Spirochaetales bacterium]
MRVLVLGSGAKDHAIAWWFSKSSYISALFVAPGNMSTEDFATNLPHINPANPQEVYATCVENKIDFVFIGTEAPLFTGVVEYISHKGITVFGAPSKSIKLEGDRAFSRSFTQRHNIPVPKNALFAESSSLEKYLKLHEGEQFIIKSNSVAPSRVMLNSADTDALLEYAKLLFTKGPVLLEECVHGIPATCTLLVDNHGYLMLPITSDYTSVSKTNTTPTGGMGAVCPVPLIEEVREKIIEKIVEPTLYGMKVEQLAYRGVLTLSLILKEGMEPVLVDYHVRFNDPATQAMVPIIKTDLIEILNAMTRNEVNTIKLETTDDCTVAVVLASPGYPLKPIMDIKINGITNVFLMNVEDKPLVFCGAIGLKDGIPVTTGGRNLTIVGRGKNIEDANKKAYALIQNKRFSDLWYREDIGNSFFKTSTFISDATF